MALGSHLITVRRLEKYINDVIGKKANLPDTSKTIIGNISQINSDLTNNICVNLLNPTEQTQTKNGVTFTNNGDGTYTVNGTASGTSIINVGSGSAIKHRGKNLCLCGCPSGGANNKYQMVMYAFDANGTIVNAWYNTGGSDRKIVPQSAVRFACGIYVYAGTTVSNLVFKPMLTTYLNAKYDDYVPYTGDSGRLNEDVAEIQANKQDKTDNALTTVAKTIVGAINELNSDLGSKSSASSISGNDAFSKINTVDSKFGGGAFYFNKVGRKDFRISGGSYITMSKEEGTQNWYMTEINDGGITVSKSTDNSASWTRLWRKTKPVGLFGATNVTNSGTQIELSNSYADYTYILVHFGRYYNNAFFLSNTMIIPTIIINGLSNQFNLSVCSSPIRNNTNSIQFGFTSSNHLTVSHVESSGDNASESYILAMECYGID